MSTTEDIAAPPPASPEANCAGMTARLRRLEELVERLTRDRARLVRENAELRRLADPRPAPQTTDALPA